MIKKRWDYSLGDNLNQRALSILVAAARILHSRSQKLVSFFATLCVCLTLATGAQAETLVVLLEGLGGRLTSPGIVSLQEELAVIPNTIVPAPIAQHEWRYAVQLIEQQELGTKIVVMVIAWEQTMQHT
jgi:hypothetical protein